MTELEFGTVRQVNPIHASGTQNRAFRIPRDIAQHDRNRIQGVRDMLRDLVRGRTREFLHRLPPVRKCDRQEMPTGT